MSNIVYVPILKYKQAEEMALRLLTTDQKKQTTPLVQLVHKFSRVRKDDGTFHYVEVPKEKVMSNTIKKICQYYVDFPKVYFDPHILFPSLDSKVLDSLNNSIEGLFESNIVPVFIVSDLTNNKDTVNLKNYLKEKGLCLRVVREEINAAFWSNIDAILDAKGLKRSDVDVIFDYKITGPDSVEHFLQQVKEDKLSNWRSITFANGAFRKDFVGLPANTYKFKREDLALWIKLHNLSQSYSKINFADYTIQYPIYVLLNKRVNPSRSIRYARKDEWIVMKGQSDTALNSAKSEQYYGHAKMLVDLKHIIANCCLVDEEIIKLSNDPTRDKGGFQRWIKLGILHHISLTLTQLAELNSQISE